MRACICPNCGANLTIDNKDRDFAFCQFCGTKILLNETIVHKTVDEAEVKRVEAEAKKVEYDAQIRMEELGIEKTKRAQLIKIMKYCVPASIIFAICAYLLGKFKVIEGISFVLGFAAWALFMGALIILGELTSSNDEADKTKAKQAKYAGLVELPKLSEDYKKKDVKEIAKIFEKAGFENITTTEKFRMSLGLRSKAGMIEKVLVDGKELDLNNYFQFHKHYKPGVLVEIYYYSN